MIYKMQSVQSGTIHSGTLHSGTYQVCHEGSKSLSDEHPRHEQTT